MTSRSVGRSDTIASKMACSKVSGTGAGGVHSSRNAVKTARSLFLRRATFLKWLMTTREIQ